MVRTRAARIATGIFFSILVALGLSLVAPPFSPPSLLAAASAGFLGFGFSETLLNAVLRKFGRAPGAREPRGTEQPGFGTQLESGEEAAENWLSAEAHKHHRHLVDSFFAQLKSLRVAPSSREPFHLELFTLTPPPGGFQLPIDASLSSLPLGEEAVSHLAADEYAQVRRAFYSLVSSVAEFNAKADRVISSIDLEGKMKRVLPNLRNESERRPLTWENYYYGRNLWLALEKTAQDAGVESQITPSGAGLEQMMPWAAGCKLVIGGYTVAHTKEARDLEALQKLINDSSRELREFVAEREVVQSGMEVQLVRFGEELRKLLADFDVRQRLHGMCHVEKSLEEQARPNQS